MSFVMTLSKKRQFKKLLCRKARKGIYPGLGPNPQPPVCKSGALPTEYPGRQLWLRFVSIRHSKLTVLQLFLLLTKMRMTLLVQIKGISYKP